MTPQMTRLEYSIVAVALLVLLLCSKPPKPGTAKPEKPYPASVEASNEMPVEANDQTALELDPGLSTNDTEAIEETPDQTLDGQTVPTEPSPDEPVPTPAPLPMPKITGAPPSNPVASSNRTPPRLVILNTQPPEQPKPSKTTEGEISVRWVWNGQKCVPQKVRVVREPNGVTKIYSLDNQDSSGSTGTK